MAIDLLALEPQQISRNLKGKFSLFYEYMLQTFVNFAHYIIRQNIV